MASTERASARSAVTPGPATNASRPGVWLTDLTLLLMAVIWGINYSSVKYGTTILDPLAFNAARVAIAAVALLVICAGARMPWPAARITVALLALGVLGNGVYQVLFVEGIARTRAGDAALVLAASPAFIALIGRVSGIERIGGRGIGGIVLSIVGIGCIVFGTAHGHPGHATLLGNMLVLFGSLSWAVYTVLLQPYTHEVNGIQLSALTMTGGAIPFVLLASARIARAPWATMPALGWVALIYSSLLALVVAYLFWYRGVRVIGPTRTAIYGNFQPVVAVLFAWATLSEVPTLWQVLGGVGILWGIVLTRA